jgi:tetratricopeptide (TPR) repeat protein
MQNHLLKNRMTFFISALLLIGVMEGYAPSAQCGQPPPTVIDVDDPERRMLYSAGDAWNSGNKREAIRRLTKAIELDPTYYLALVERAQAYYEFKNYRKAWKDLDRAEKCEQDERLLTMVQEWRAYILLSQGKVKAASRLLEDAIRIRPDIPRYSFARGVIAQERNDFSGALKNYDTGLAELDKYPAEQKDLRARILFNKSMCLRRTGRAKDAITTLKLACTISPALESRKRVYKVPTEPIYMLSMTGFEVNVGFPDQNEVLRTRY